MLARVYIDNYACFVNFEFRLARKQLICGSNGTGKTKFYQALVAIQRIVSGGERVDGVLPEFLRTRWQNSALQTFEIDAELEGRTYLYRLVVERDGRPSRAQVKEESVHCDGNRIFSFERGEVRHFNDDFVESVRFPFNPIQSALSIAAPGPDSTLLAAFLRWMSSLWFFQINPMGMDTQASLEVGVPNFNMSNFAAWYRHLAQDDPRGIGLYLSELRTAIDSFSDLRLKQFGETVRAMFVEFQSESSSPVSFLLGELSDGQRCLIALYALLNFAIRRGQTIFLDEPDNYIALREIQPWLTAVEDALEEGRGQLVLVSHHPEILNQWLPDFGVQFRRDELGPVRVTPYQHPPDSPLLPAELIARGWNDE